MTDVLPAGSTANLGAARATGHRRRLLTWTFAGVAMVLLVMAPALWNGFPLIFPDTGGYVTRLIEGTLGMGRSALYGVFLYAGVPLSFWPNVVLQAALTVWLIVLTMRTHGLGGRPWLALGVVAMLAVCTSLPWFASQLMPDILFFCVVLALALLAFRSAQLSWRERAGLVAVIVAAIPSHMAAAGMCVGIIAALWVLSRIRIFALPAPRLWLATGAVAAGIAMCPVSNDAITGNFAFTPGGTSFLFGRLIEDGIVARYLDEQCPDPALKLCAAKDELPKIADDWLWGENNLFNRIGGHDAWEAEEKAIILATIARYPLTHAATAIADTFSQFVSFRTEISMRDNEPTIATFGDRFPALYPRFMKARQQDNKFDIAPLNALHVPVAAIAIAGIGAALLWRRRLGVAPELAALCLTILLALAANAAICGIFSHPVGRYQSRLVPLAPLALALVIAQRRRGPAQHAGPPAATA